MTKRATYTRLFVAVAFATAGAFAVAASGCSSPDASVTVDPTAGDAGPSRTQFAFVAPVLEKRCGSIDCHGSIYRNMRIYGFGGLRLPSPLGATTPQTPSIVTDEEAQASYESVVGLEPEIMRTVVSQGGAGIERLTFVRKGRGTEDHKGNKRLDANSDTCVATWLAGHVDEDACRRGGCFTTNAGGINQFTTSDGGPVNPCEF